MPIVSLIFIVVVGGRTVYEGPNPPSCAPACDDNTVYAFNGVPPVAGAVQETVSCPRCPGVVVSSPAVSWPGPVVVDVAITFIGA